MGMASSLLWLVFSLLHHVCANMPVFLVDPVSVAAIDGITVEFTCTANNTDDILYRVNGTFADSESMIAKFFHQLAAEVLETDVFRRNLTALVSSQYNNTEIKCVALPGDVPSEIANLTIQGPLSSVGDLSYCYINSSTINISWSPPFTLPGTAITGYNISVTSNGTTTNYFTSDSYYVLQLSDITDSPRNEINITVSGYNGLNGETDSITGIYQELGDMITVSSLYNNTEIFCTFVGSSDTREPSTIMSVTSPAHTNTIAPTTTSSPSATPSTSPSASPGDTTPSTSPSAPSTSPGDAQTTTTSTIAITIGAVIIVLLAVV